MVVPASVTSSGLTEAGFPEAGGGGGGGGGSSSAEGQARSSISLQPRAKRVKLGCSKCRYARNGCAKCWMLKLGNETNNNKNDDDSQSPASPPTQPTPRMAAPVAHAEMAAMVSTDLSCPLNSNTHQTNYDLKQASRPTETREGERHATDGLHSGLCGQEAAATAAARTARPTPRAPPAFAEATQLSQASVACGSAANRKRRREPLFANLTVLITGVKLATDAARQKEVKQLTALVTSHGGIVLDRLPPILPASRTPTKGRATAVAAAATSAEVAVATVTIPPSPTARENVVNRPSKRPRLHPSQSKSSSRSEL